MKFDQTRYQSWQTVLAGRRVLREIVVFFGIYSVLYFFAIGGWLLYEQQYRIIVFALIAFIVARFLFVSSISFFYKKERPYQLYKFTPVRFSWLLSYQSIAPVSFPSGHTSGMASISTILIFFNPWIGGIGFFVTVLCAVARVMMGYHYPRDIVVGLVLGVLAGFLVPMVSLLF